MGMINLVDITGFSDRYPTAIDSITGQRYINKGDGYELVPESQEMKDLREAKEELDAYLKGPK